MKTMEMKLERMLYDPRTKFKIQLWASGASYFKRGIRS